MILVRQTMKRSMAAILPRERFLIKGPATCAATLSAGPIEIALTFDDGPHPAWTPAVLDELSEAGWKGTFFVIGERAEQCPQLLRQIVEQGHALGNHTYRHSLPEKTSAATFLDEITRTRAIIEQLTGTTTALVRPPLGKLTWGKLSGLWKARQSVILWNIDPKDFAMRGDSEPCTWVESYRPRGGDVVLLHDRLPYAASIVRTMAARHGDTVRSVSVTDWLPAAAGVRLSLEASRG